MLEQLKFPIGKYVKPAVIDAESIESWIKTITDFPEQLSSTTALLDNNQLDTQYRPDGWTIRQVVHHCADSHMNALIRFKLALTEDQPTIKPYAEALWAELPDSILSIEPSLKIIEGVHKRWGELLKLLSQKELKRTLFHPEHKKTFALDEYIGNYAWHCTHHLAHIQVLKKQKGW